MITSDIPTGKGGGEKANYFIIIVHLLSSFIISYHHRKCGYGSRRLHQSQLSSICLIIHTKCAIVNQSRTASYPTAPSQIPACGTIPPAAGLFESAHLRTDYSIFPAVRFVRLRRISFTSYTDPSSPSPCGRLSLRAVGSTIRKPASEYYETI